ncbi:F-box/FBD/LRR-repeat protein At5g56420-like [Chenopodium quinoa]|uniref:F-box/FBD/LRR-repeat protein At5g56420-like n=1 Tax=Chenopodium quinoa TaxID=63459 RepID=UPI000B7712F4|nr:F-box/FBD/LRR-repeat protein At5g56420-like [Chenopodium quinoa]
MSKKQGENLRKINPKVPYSEATSVAQNLFNLIQNRGPVTIGTNAQMLVNMSPSLIIAAGVLCGFCAIRLGCFVGNHTISSKVDDTYNDGYKKLNGESPADQVDDTSNDGYKKLDGEILANHEDRFTQLPNELLSCILTHMTLRDVVRITTLSKQWKNIWSLLSNLDLNWQVISGYNGCCLEDGCEFYRQAYVKRVNKVLLKCGNHEISSFRLSFCFTKEYASHVDYWIRFASKKRLESLTLQFVCAGHSDSLCQIMTCEHLKLRVLYTITCSFLSQLPCLKNLRLDACNLKLHIDFRFNKLVRLDLYYVFLEGNQLQWLLSNSSTIE